MELRPDSPEGREYRAFHQRCYAFLVTVVAEGVVARAYNRVCDVLPRGLRNAITIVFARD